ncbi:MAG: hypothetical protein HRT45_07215 [Bdellovibrionales bacterium]|nr:hypothetical protein [Bdellovibrionales bacterium]
MKAIITFIVLGIGCATSSYAVPIDSLPLLRAGELDRVTNRSIQLESDQYSRLAQWRIASDKLKTAQVKQEVAQAEFDRIAELYDRGISTESQYMQADLNRKVANAQVEIESARLKKVEAETRMVQLLMIEEGSPAEDHRYEMVALLKQKAEYTVNILGSQMGSVQSSIGFYEHQYEITRKLFEKGHRTKAQVEQWQVRLQGQRELLATLQHQVQSAQLEIEGAELAMKRLSNHSS